MGPQRQTALKVGKSPANWLPFCTGLDVLIGNDWNRHYKLSNLLCSFVKGHLCHSNWLLARQPITVTWRERQDNPIHWPLECLWSLKCLYDYICKEIHMKNSYLLAQVHWSVAFVIYNRGYIPLMQLEQLDDLVYAAKQEKRDYLIIWNYFLFIAWYPHFMPPDGK